MPARIRALTRGERIAADQVNNGFTVRVMRSGLAAAVAAMSDGRRQIMCLHAPGDVICPLGPRDAECWTEVLTDSDVCEITYQSGKGHLSEDPTTSALLFRLAHESLQRLSAHSVLLGRFDGTERLAAFLADMAHRIGKRTDQGYLLTLPMSREDIADFLGLNAETISRLLTRMKKAGLVNFTTPTRCEIPDLARLEEMAPLRFGPDAH